MQTTFLAGKILINNVERLFSMNNGIVEVEGWGLDEHDTHYSYTQEILKMIDKLHGKLVDGRKVEFINCKNIGLRINLGHRRTRFRCDAIVVYNHNREEDQINGVKLNGGILDLFGDVVAESYKSDQETDSNQFPNVENFKFSPTSFLETDVKFDTTYKNRIAILSISVPRELLLSQKSLSRLHRYFHFISKEVKIDSSEIPNLLVEMLEFLANLSKSSFYYFDDISITTNYKDDSRGVLQEEIGKILIMYNRNPYDNEIYRVKIKDFEEVTPLKKLWTITQEISEYHLLEPYDITSGYFDFKEILEIIIYFEQITSHFNIEQGEIDEKIITEINRICETYKSEKTFRSLSHHISLFKRRQIDDVAVKYIEKDSEITNAVIALLGLEIKSNKRKNCAQLRPFLEECRKFRNAVVHSASNYTISVDLQKGAKLILYLNYVILLKESGYTSSRANKIASKYFES